MANVHMYDASAPTSPMEVDRWSMPMGPNGDYPLPPPSSPPPGVRPPQMSPPPNMYGKGGFVPPPPQGGSAYTPPPQPSGGPAYGFQGPGLLPPPPGTPPVGKGGYNFHAMGKGYASNRAARGGSFDSQYDPIQYTPPSQRGFDSNGMQKGGNQKGIFDNYISQSYDNLVRTGSLSGSAPRRERPYHFVTCISCGDENQRHYWKVCGNCGTSMTNQTRIDQLQQEGYDSRADYEVPLLDPTTEAQYLDFVNCNRPPAWLIAALNDPTSESARMLLRLKCKPPWFDKFATNKFVKIPIEIAQHLMSLPPLNAKPIGDARAQHTQEHVSSGPSPLRADSPFAAGCADTTTMPTSPGRTTTMPTSLGPLMAAPASPFHAIDPANPPFARSSSPFKQAAAQAQPTTGVRKSPFITDLQIGTGSIFMISDKEHAHDQSLVTFDKIDPENSENIVVTLQITDSMKISLTVPIESLKVPTAEQVIRMNACDNPACLLQAIAYAFAPQPLVFNNDATKALEDVQNMLLDNAKQCAELDEYVKSIELSKYQLIQQHAELQHKRYSIVTKEPNDPAALSPINILEAVPAMRIGYGAKEALIKIITAECEGNASATVHEAAPTKTDPYVAPTAHDPDDTFDDSLSDLSVTEFGDLDPNDRQSLDAASRDVAKARDAFRAANVAVNAAENAISGAGGDADAPMPASVKRSSPASPDKQTPRSKGSPSKTPDRKTARLAVGSPKVLAPSPSPVEAARIIASRSVSRRRR